MEVGGCTTCTGLRAQIQHVLTRPGRKDREGYVGLSHIQRVRLPGFYNLLRFVISSIVNNTNTLAVLLSVDRSPPPSLECVCSVCRGPSVLHLELQEHRTLVKPYTLSQLVNTASALCVNYDFVR